MKNDTVMLYIAEQNLRKLSKKIKCTFLWLLCFSRCNKNQFIESQSTYCNVITAQSVMKTFS